VKANPVSPTELARTVSALLERATPVDALALTGGEPLAQSDFLSTVLEVGRFNVPVLLETNGVLPHRLSDVLPFVDIISMDIKPPSNTGEGPFWQEHAAFLALARAKELYVKLLVDETTIDQDIERAVAMLAPISPAVPTFLQPITNRHGELMISSERLTHLYLLARSRLASLRVLPQVHKLLGIR
jgi:7-carboxy-7-deazaguanine synthase